MATTAVPITGKKIAKKRVFDLDKFEKVTLEAQYDEPSPLTDVTELGKFDSKQVLAYVNEGLKRQAWKDARASIPGASPKVVNQTVNAFRLYMFTDKLVKDSAGEVTPESRKLQTQAIYAFIRANEPILNSIREFSARAVDEDEEDDTEE